MESSHSSSNQFYDAFRSEGPLKKKTSEEEAKSNQDDDLWFTDKAAEEVVKVMDEDDIWSSPTRKRRSYK